MALDKGAWNRIPGEKAVFFNLHTEQEQIDTYLARLHGVPGCGCSAKRGARLSKTGQGPCGHRSLEGQETGVCCRLRIEPVKKAISDVMTIPHFTKGGTALAGLIHLPVRLLR